MISFAAWIARDWPLIVALAFCFLAGAASERAWWRWQRRRKANARSNGKAAPRRLTLVPKPSATFDHADQLRVVERATFTRRSLLNQGERRLLRVLEEACAAEAKGWRVMAQVSLGEVLASTDKNAYRAINSKRVDLLLIDDAGVPQHAIEMQGSGHHLGPAATRDAIKKEALRRAGVGYVEVFPDDTPAEVRAKVAKMAKRRATIAELQDGPG